MTSRSLLWAQTRQSRKGTGVCCESPLQVANWTAPLLPACSHSHLPQSKEVSKQVLPAWVAWPSTERECVLITVFSFRLCDCAPLGFPLVGTLILCGTWGCPRPHAFLLVSLGLLQQTPSAHSLCFSHSCCQPHVLVAMASRAGPWHGMALVSPVAARGRD